jgi:hypothetical protein
MNRLVKVILLVMMITPAILFGQERPVPVNISLFNESTAIPFTRLLTFPVHPGIQIGTEFYYKIKKYSRLFQAADICYFYHNYLSQGIGIHTDLGYEYRLKNGIALSGLLGIGYMQTFATTEEFTFSNGHYEKKADRGNARLCPSFSVDIGYYTNKTVKNSLKIFIRYQSWAEYPYSPGFIPVMTHINLHAGVKFMISSKRKENE